MNILKLLPASSMLYVALHGADAPAKQPNVLFIAVDDLNDWIGCLGGHPADEDAGLRPTRSQRCFV